MCKSDHAMMQKGATKMSDKECAMACSKSGQKYVLVSNGKVYQIENQTAAGLAANAGGTVKVTGERTPMAVPSRLPNWRLWRRSNVAVVFDPAGGTGDFYVLDGSCPRPPSPVGR